jgi:acyl carrier protein
MSQAKPTPEHVRSFILSLYSDKLDGKQPESIGDDFDLLTEGVIDSMGLIELVGSLEKEYGMELDMSGMDTEQLTLLGPLSKFVSAQTGGADVKPNP